MACWAPQPPPGFGPPPPGFGPPPPMYGSQPPPPAFNGNTRYHYHTRDGGPPSDGKPPAAPAPGAPPLPYGFAPAPPAGMFGPPPGPSPMACYMQGPPASTQPPPPPGWTCYPNGQAAPAPGPAKFAGAIFATPDDDAPAPGNRVNGRLAKVDDGSGVLMPEEMTTFHVLNPGVHFDRIQYLQKDLHFKVQNADSHWQVKHLIMRLGGLDAPRLQPNWTGRTDLVGIQEYHEIGNGKFEKGTLIMHDDPKSDCTLAQIGWSSDRGRAGQRPPVWVVLYPVK